MVTTIAPWLSVPDGRAAVDFYRAAFGAVVLEQLEDGAGQVVVAQLTLDGAPFWVQTDAASNPSPGAVPVRMVVIVDDPDARFERAVAAGASSVAAIHDAHGWRTGRVADPCGHHWEFARQLTPRR